jgi:endonuclease/exonuclease/phosphatase (EEP) superfamily protein YafD
MQVRRPKGWRVNSTTSWPGRASSLNSAVSRRCLRAKPERIDYQFTKGVTVSEMFVMKTRRSDHHALVADYNVQ